MRNGSEWRAVLDRTFAKGERERGSYSSTMHSCELKLIVVTVWVVGKGEESSPGTTTQGGMFSPDPQLPGDVVLPL